MFIASQHAKSQSKRSNTRSFCPIWFKIISFQDHCTSCCKFNILDAHCLISCQKYHQPLNFKIPHSNSTQRPIVPIETTYETNLVAVFRNTNNSDISETNGMQQTWNWHTKCPAYMYTMCQNFSPLTQAVQKLSPKVFILDSFQDPCSISFQDHHIVLNIGLSHICCMFRKGKDSYYFPFKDPHSRHSYSF